MPRSWTGHDGVIDGVARMEKSLNGGLLEMLLHGDRDRDWNGLCTGCCAGAQASLFSCLSALRYPLLVERWSHDCFHSFFLVGLCIVPVASSSQFMMGP